MDCFTRFKIGTNAFEVNHVRDFSTRLDKGGMTCESPIPCHVTATAQPKVIVLTAFDFDYYYPLYFDQDDPTLILGDSSVDVFLFIRKNLETACSFGVLAP